MCCSASSTTSSRCGARADLAGTASTGRPLVPRLPGAGQAPSRCRRASAAAQLLLSRRGISRGAPDQGRRPVRRWLRRDRDPPAPRQRHGREFLPARSRDFCKTLHERHGALPRDPRTGQLRFRLHPRQLVPGQLARRRSLVRHQQRTDPVARARLLRRLHPALGAERHPDQHGQCDLLRHRRSAQAEVARSRRAGARRRQGQWRPDDRAGAAGPELAQAPFRRDSAHRECRRAPRLSTDAASAWMPGCARASMSRAGRSGCSSRSIRTAPRSATWTPCWAPRCACDARRIWRRRYNDGQQPRAALRDRARGLQHHQGGRSRQAAAIRGSGATSCCRRPSHQRAVAAHRDVAIDRPRPAQCRNG